MAEFENLTAFLAESEAINWRNTEIASLASSLNISGDELETARRCFEFVRDEIRHSRDYQCGPSTCRASDVLYYRTGYCFAKSHLLAALLRANGIPSGLCYQRLSINDSGAPYTLHGFNAIWLDGVGWYRVDARGNRDGIDAQFEPPLEKLAFPLQDANEVEFAEVLAEPLPVVIEVLERAKGWVDVLCSLPDVLPEEFESLGLSVRFRGPQ